MDINKTINYLVLPGIFVAMFIFTGVRGLITGRATIGRGSVRKVLTGPSAIIVNVICIAFGLLMGSSMLSTALKAMK